MPVASSFTAACGGFPVRQDRHLDGLGVVRDHLVGEGDVGVVEVSCRLGFSVELQPASTRLTIRAAVIQMRCRISSSLSLRRLCTTEGQGSA